jgi:hypothetical protein
VSEMGFDATATARDQRDADLQAIIDQLNGPNPHGEDMNLPPGMAEDGAP